MRTIRFTQKQADFLNEFLWARGYDSAQAVLDWRGHPDPLPEDLAAMRPLLINLGRKIEDLPLRPEDFNDPERSALLLAVENARPLSHLCSTLRLARHHRRRTAVACVNKLKRLGVPVELHSIPEF